MFVTVGADVTQAVSGLGSVQNAMKKAGSDIQSAGRDLTVGITAPIAAVAALTTKFGSGFESAMARVAKTSGLGAAEVEALGKDLRALAVTPEGAGLTAEALAGIAAEAAQAGISSQGLVEFTKNVAQMSGATGIAAEQITTDMAGIAAVTKLPEESFKNLASSIVQLGNEFAGSEAEIIEITNRLVGTLSNVGVPVEDITGIAGAMNHLRINAEAGGTAVSKFFLEMATSTVGAGKVTEEQAKKIQNQQDRVTDLGKQLQVATERQKQFGRNTPAATVQQTTDDIAKYQRELGQANANLAEMKGKAGGAGGKLGAFAQVAGVTTDQFKNLIEADPTQAFVRVIEGIGRIRSSQGKTAALGALEDIGIDDTRMRDAILKLSSDSGILDKALQSSRKAFEEGTAAAKENEVMMGTTEKRWALLTNTLQEEFLKVWDTVKTDVQAGMELFRTQVVPRLQDAVAAFQKLSPETRQAILLFAGLAAAVGPALIVIGAFVTILGTLFSPVVIAAALVAFLALAWINNWGDIRSKVGDAVTAVAGFLRNDLGTALQVVTVAAAIAGVILSAVLIKNLLLLANTVRFLAPLMLMVGKSMAVSWLAAAGPIALILLGIAALITSVFLLKAAWDTNFLGMRDAVSGVVEMLGNLFEMIANMPGPDWMMVGNASLRQWRDHAQAAKEFVDRAKQGQSAVPALQGVADAMDKTQGFATQFATGFKDAEAAAGGAFATGLEKETPALTKFGVPGTDLAAAAELARGMPVTGVPRPVAPNVSVNINNPMMTDQGMIQSIIDQTANAVSQAIIIAEGMSSAPPQPGLPGQPHMQFGAGPF